MNNYYKQFVDRLLNCFACSFFFLIFSHFFNIDIQETFLNFLFFSVFFVFSLDILLSYGILLFVLGFVCCLKLCYLSIDVVLC